MYFRFGFALLLVLAVSLAGVAVEKATLSTRRDISRQHYQLDALREERARLRLRTQKLGAPARLLRDVEEGRIDLKRPQ
ncbi:MAG: hypothetical protein ACE5KM_20375 [Planctomycetaceae bacterium]